MRSLSRPTPATAHLYQKPRALRLPKAVLFISALGCNADPPGASKPRVSPSAIASAPLVHAAQVRSAAVAPDSSIKSVASAVPPPAPERPRVYARSRFVWIWPRPDVTSQWIGFLWLGGSVPVKSNKPIVGVGCERFVAIEPRGYVCVDDRKATLDGEDPFLESVKAYVPQLDTPWPHRYGESIGLERFPTLPNEEQQRARERDYAYHLSRVDKARRGETLPEMAGIDFSDSPLAAIQFPLPPNGMNEHLSDRKARSTVAWSAEGLAFGRSWLLSADLMWVAKDRVKVYPKITFEGVHLDGQIRLPLAFFRDKNRAVFARDREGVFSPTGKHHERLSWISLTGKSEVVAEGQRDDTKQLEYLEAVDGTWIRADDAVLPSPQSHTPWGATVGQPDNSDHAPKGRQTWIEVSIRGGWLIAYEGTRPVYATMVSPGRGGPPVTGKTPLSTASTPTGRFNITGKFMTATMEAPGEYVHSDVPWTQNFSGPHALHGAYWHDDWGHLKSAGCINVSPKDGQWLFQFTEPRVPPGWHGVRWLPYLEPASTLIVHS